MAWRHYIDKDLHCIFIQHFGEIDINEFTDQVAELTALPHFDLGMSVLRDISPTTLPPEYDMSGIKKILEARTKSQKEALGKNRKAAWVVGNAKDFKLVHQFCALTRLDLAIVDRQPFRDVDRAMEWLGIPDGYAISYPE